MAIVGLTVSEAGEAIQRLAVTTKVAIGEVVKTATGTRPSKLDHFVFLRKGVKLEWEADPELTKFFGPDCRDVGIILLDDCSENVFRTEYAWWSKTEKKCWGDGRKATRRTEAQPDGEEWTPCGDGCPELDKNICKPSGDLYFILAGFPRLGAVCRLHTTSYRSVRQIHSAIEQIRTVTGGRLAGIRCQLVVRPEKAAYFDTKLNKKVSTTIYALNIELSAQGMAKLIATMTENAKLFEQTRKLLGDGRKVEYVVEPEAEVERAPDIAQEFYPAEDIKPEIRQPERASAAAPNGGNGQAATAVVVISGEQWKDLLHVMVEAGYSNGQAREIMQEKWGISKGSEIPLEWFPGIRLFFESNGVEDFQSPYQATDDDLPF